MCVSCTRFVTGSRVPFGPSLGLDPLLFSPEALPAPSSICYQSPPIRALFFVDRFARLQSGKLRGVKTVTEGSLKQICGFTVCRCLGVVFVVSRQCPQH